MSLHARIVGRDFYTFVAAALLQVDYYDVMTVERAYVKDGLFFSAYSRRFPIAP